MRDRRERVDFIFGTWYNSIVSLTNAAAAFVALVSCEGGGKPTADITPGAIQASDRLCFFQVFRGDLDRFRSHILKHPDNAFSIHDDQERQV